MEANPGAEIQGAFELYQWVHGGARLTWIGPGVRGWQYPLPAGSQGHEYRMSKVLAWPDGDRYLDLFISIREAMDAIAEDWSPGPNG